MKKIIEELISPVVTESDYNIAGLVSERVDMEFRGLNGWMIKITPEGEILFNTEAYPKMGVTDFAKEFIKSVRAIW